MYVRAVAVAGQCVCVGCSREGVQSGCSRVCALVAAGRMRARVLSREASSCAHSHFAPPHSQMRTQVPHSVASSASLVPVMVQQLLAREQVALEQQKDALEQERVKRQREQDQHELEMANKRLELAAVSLRREGVQAGRDVCGCRRAGTLLVQEGCAQLWVQACRDVVVAGRVQACRDVVVAGRVYAAVCFFRGRKGVRSCGCTHAGALRVHAGRGVHSRGCREGASLILPPFVCRRPRTRAWWTSCR